MRPEVGSDLVLRILTSNEFQTLGAENRKARDPKVKLWWMTESQPKNTWRQELENEMWTAGFRYSWRKMEETAQDRAGWRRVVCGSDKA